MTDFQEKIQTGILTLCFHSRHLAFTGLAVIKGRCAGLCCKLKLSGIYVSSHSYIFMRTFFRMGGGSVDRGDACFAVNKIYPCYACTYPNRALLFFG